MYGYNRAVYGVNGLGGEPSLAEIAQHWSTTPKAGYTEHFQDLQLGQEIWGTPEAAKIAKMQPERFNYLGSDKPLWKDPWVMVPIAGAAALITLGILFKW